jgi:hypothetical protein
MIPGQSLLGEQFVWVVGCGGGGGLKVSLVLALVQNLGLDLDFDLNQAEQYLIYAAHS